MDFITWWFDKHYILSTILTAKWTLLWCFYKGLVGRGIVAFLLSGSFGVGAAVVAKKAK